VLRQTLENAPETVQELELAAADRYWEGLELMALGRHGAGIYLMGYVAEMRIKLACFRLLGASNVDPVESLRTSARRRASSAGLVTDHEGYHSLVFWHDLIVHQRSLIGRPALSPDFTHRVGRLYHTWWVEMRYHPDVATATDADHVFEDVSWLDRNYAMLWT
jgi:hypothetical protein